MGFFDKVFKKKICDVCGEEIGLLGNRKLEDGNLCKNCAKKLSPWFSDRRESTVEEIKAQLADREANLDEVKKFRVSRSLGRYGMILIDEQQGKFIATYDKDWRDENPDVLKISDITGFDFDVDRDRDEMTYRDSDGEEQRYDPPRYRHEFDFWLKIMVNNPYFDCIRLHLNRSDVEIIEIRETGIFARRFDPEHYGEYQEYVTIAKDMQQALESVKVPEPAPEEAPAAPPQDEKVICPWCGATTSKATGHCEVCTGTL